MGRAAGRGGWCCWRRRRHHHVAPRTPASPAARCLSLPPSYLTLHARPPHAPALPHSHARLTTSPPFHLPQHRCHLHQGLAEPQGQRRASCLWPPSHHEVATRPSPHARTTTNSHAHLLYKHMHAHHPQISKSYSILCTLLIQARHTYYVLISPLTSILMVTTHLRQSHAHRTVKHLLLHSRTPLQQPHAMYCTSLAHARTPIM